MTQKILLVDDEPMIIDVGKQMLEKVGYDVMTAKSGREAVQIFSKHSEHIHLVVLDMIMPGMDGSKTFDLLRDINPSIPVLLSSGYSLNGQANKIMQKGCDGFIQKPFDSKKLSEKIEDIWVNSPFLQDLRDRQKLKGRCGKCEYKYVCGGCRARALAYHDDYMMSDPGCFRKLTEGD